MKTLLTSLLLLLIAVLGFLGIKYTGIFYTAVIYVILNSIWVGSISQYFYTCAYIIDVLVQVLCGKFIQLVFTKKIDTNAPWGRPISISACFGYEEINSNLNYLGVKMVTILNKIERNHCVLAYYSEKIKL